MSVGMDGDEVAQVGKEKEWKEEDSRLNDHLY